jgi:hypothetical protein
MADKLRHTENLRAEKERLLAAAKG